VGDNVSVCVLYQVEEVLGVPADQQRYWVWQLRQNKTYRPTQRLKADEEKSMIVDLREHREMSVSSSRGTPGGLQG